jgi:hypothetical protein
MSCERINSEKLTPLRVCLPTMQPAPRITALVFLVSALDRIHAWIFALLWSTLLSLVAALGRSYTIQWITYCQAALFWYPIAIADGLYMYCPQQQTGENKQACSHGAQTRRLLASVAVTVAEAAVVLTMIILAVQSPDHNDVARLRDHHIERFLVLIITQAALAAIAGSHVVCQWSFGAYPGRMLHARLN